MGHTKRKRPERGSKQFWPRVRAKRMYPKVRSYKKTSETKLLGFAGYKAGMTHAFFVDNRPKSPTKGEEVRIPVTVLETPALRVLSVRLYSKSAYGSSVLGEAWSDQLTQELAKRLKLPKKRSDNINKLDINKASEVRVLVYTQPKLTGFGKKRPDVFELAIGGDVKAQFEFAKKILGTEIPISSVFNAGDVLDVHSVTKGKGFQGVIKRFGVKILPRKAETRRKIGTMGPWTPKKVGWWISMPGQMGFHNRTEYNKQLVKIGSKDITPNGGFVGYGEVKGDYVLIAGSVPGPKKRLIRLTPAIRGKALQPQEIIEVSRRAQQ